MKAAAVRSANGLIREEAELDRLSHPLGHAGLARGGDPAIGATQAGCGTRIWPITFRRWRFDPGAGRRYGEIARIRRGTAAPRKITEHRARGKASHSGRAGQDRLLPTDPPVPFGTRPEIIQRLLREILAGMSLHGDPVDISRSLDESSSVRPSG